MGDACKSCGCRFHGHFAEDGSFVYSGSVYADADAKRAALSDEDFLAFEERRWTESSYRSEGAMRVLRQEGSRLLRMAGREGHAQAIDGSVLDRLFLREVPELLRAARERLRAPA